MSVEGTTLYSVGHGARTAAELVDLLRSAGIRWLVDVRTAPGSKKHPQFGRAELERTLALNGIEYVWRRDLGGWRKPDPDSPNVAIRSPGFRGYADHMRTDEFERALAWLVETSVRTPTAFMCAESLWWRCHRRMIADALVARGIEVVHLMNGGRRDPHRLHPSARLEGTTVVYDRAEPDQARLLPEPRPTPSDSATDANASSGSRISPSRT